MGATTNEIPRIREAGDHPPGRAIAPAGAPHAGKLGIPRSTFNRWYDRFLAGGVDALEDRRPRPNRVWNRIPEAVRDQIIELALNEPELSPRELAVTFTDTKGLLCLGILGLSPAQGPRPDHQPGLHRHQGRRRVPGQDDGAQPALADRLHLS
jgi:hypothetical protein